MTQGSDGRMGGRAVAAMVDEGLSSLQNFAIIFPALHFFSVSGIGEFTLAYTIALLLETVLKSMLLEPLTIRFSAAGQEEQRRAGAHVAGACLVAGLIFVGLSILVSLLFTGPARWLIIVVGIAVLALVVQEAWRVYFYTIARPWRAAANDALCFVTTVLLVVLAAGRDAVYSPAVLLGLWAAGTGLGAIFGCAQARLVPAPQRAWDWILTHWMLGGRLAGARIAMQGFGRLSLVLVSVIAGAAALGQYSAVRTLVAPMTTLTTSVVTFAVPEAARLHAKASRRLGRLVRGFSLLLAGAFGLFGLVAFLLPEPVGEVIAGDNWSVARSLLLPVLIAGAVEGLRQGPRVGLMVFERSSTVFRLAVATGVAVLVGTVIGALASGAAGAAWGFAIAQAGACLLWWLIYRGAEVREFGNYDKLQCGQ